MMTFHGALPLFDHLELESRPGPPRRLDVHQRKLEHDRMYLSNYEVERLARPTIDRHQAEQFAELALANPTPSRLDRIRNAVSDSLVIVADAVRPTEATRRDIARAR